MNSKIILAIVIVGAAAAAVFMAQGGFTVRELVHGPAESPQAEPQIPVQATAPDTSQGDAARPDVESVARLLAAMPRVQRDAVLARPETFSRLVDGESGFQSLLMGAGENRMLENENIRLLMKRQAEKALVDAYVRELVKVNIGPDFPSEEQVLKYYQDNKDRFTTPERVHLWQIFWPVPENAAEQERKKTLASATKVLKQLEKKELEFGQAASEYSAHSPSKLSGGYMGLLNTADLLPEVRASVKQLKEGQLSKILTTSSGLHLVKRGALVASRENALADILPQVRARLIRDADAQFRAAVQKKALEQYGLAIPEDEKEQWRQQLDARFSP